MGASVTTKWKPMVPLVAVALVGIGATEAARHYRFSDPSIANMCDCITYGALGVIFLFCAKINLTRIPQHQNLALFAAVVAGFSFAVVVDKIFSLTLK